MLAVALSSTLSLILASISFNPVSSHPIPSPSPTPSPGPSNHGDISSGINAVISFIGGAGFTLATRSQNHPTFLSISDIYIGKLAEIFTQIESSLSVETDAGSALDLEAVLSLLESIPTTLDAYTADVYALKAYDSQSVEERLGGLSEKEVAAKVGQVVNGVLAGLDVIAEIFIDAGLSSEIQHPSTIDTIGSSISAFLTAVTTTIISIKPLLPSIILPIPTTLAELGLGSDSNLDSSSGDLIAGHGGGVDTALCL